MLLLAIAGLVLALGFLGLRTSGRSYFIVCAIAAVLGYTEYTR